MDLVLTDPPYGIKADSNPIRGKSIHENFNFDENIPRKEIFDLMFSVSRAQVVWGGNYFTEYLKPSMGWVVWDKENGEFSLSDGELAWTSLKKALRIFSKSRAAVTAEDFRWHPTQKSLYVIKKCIDYAKDFKGLILDPFLGSGTTLVACKELNRNGIGIEINPKYCEIAKRRLINTQRMML